MIVKVKSFKSPILIKSRMSNASSEEPKTPKAIYTPKKIINESKDEINESKDEIEELKKKLKDKETSIQHLNNLIGNEE